MSINNYICFLSSNAFVSRLSLSVFKGLKIEGRGARRFRSNVYSSEEDFSINEVFAQREGCIILGY